MPPAFKLFIADGVAVYIGRNVQTKLHTHHALEIVMAFNAPFLLSRNGTEFEKSDCSFVTADLAHQFMGQDDFYVFIYFDAELHYALQLEKKLNLAEHGIIHYVGKEITAIRNLFIDWFSNDSSGTKDPLSILQLLLQAIIGYPEKSNTIEPRIWGAIKIVQSSLHEEFSLEKIAASVFLSESRFAHLFKEQTGIPFRRYVLWCRIQTALKAVIQGKSFTEAAYEGGFSDVAHLSRTFSEMFGVSPSDVLKK